MSKVKYDKYLEISKNEVKTKFDCKITLSLDEYNIFDNELLDERKIKNNDSRLS